MGKNAWSNDQGFIPQRLHPFARSVRQLWRRWVDPVWPIQKTVASFGLYAQYWADWVRYARMPNAERLRLIDGYPCLTDRTATTPFDSHYFYQDIWAFKAIQASGIENHIDVGSRVILVGMLTAITKVTFVDIRPLIVNLENYNSLQASILTLPFRDNSVASLSCLHVAEHIGLGRYGDPLDPEGTKKAARELARVLAPGGNLYFALPVGRLRVCFNAHRIHSPQQVLRYFDNLRPIQISGIGDDRIFREGIAPDDLADATYACGLFHFTKEL